MQNQNRMKKWHICDKCNKHLSSCRSLWRHKQKCRHRWASNQEIPTLNGSKSHTTVGGMIEQEPQTTLFENQILDEEQKEQKSPLKTIVYDELMKYMKPPLDEEDKDEEISTDD